MPLFPGTGSISERGEYDNIVNALLRAGDSGETFREAFEIVILPKLQEFGPDLIVISAGFDAHRLDPLANLNLSEDDFIAPNRADDVRYRAIVSRKDGRRHARLRYKVICSA